MRRLSALIIATLFLAVSATAAAAACPGDKSAEGKKWGFKEKLGHELRTYVGLDEELAKKVEAVFESHSKAVVEAKKEKKAALKELRGLLKAEPSDDAAIGKSLARVKAAEKAIEAIQEKEFDEAAKLLTVKQQAKLHMALYELQHGKSWHGKKHKGCDGKGSCGCGDKECTGKPDCPCGKPDCKCKEGK